MGSIYMLRMPQLKAKNTEKNNRSTANPIPLWLIFFLQLSLLTRPNPQFISCVRTLDWN